MYFDTYYDFLLAENCRYLILQRMINSHCTVFYKSFCMNFPLGCTINAKHG